MSAVLTADAARAWLLHLADAIARERDTLTRLDAAIGDGDHGINMDRGFAAIRTQIGAASPSDLGALLKAAGSTLVSTVGGASGPLYGTAFLRMGAALTGHAEAGLPDLAAAFGAAFEGMAQRGKSARGEKTLLDAFGPALDRIRVAAESGQDLAAALADAALAAQEGAVATIPLRAARGRAAFLGERSIGHQDPGATSAALLFRTLAETVAGS